MKLISEMEPEKLRGAFYTPASLVEFCFERISERLGARRPLHILEPSAGDGAFVRGLKPFVVAQKIHRPHITCVELIAAEADQCRYALEQNGMEGTIACQSFFDWAGQNKQLFDAVAGNPPFIRYQFVPEQDRLWAEWLLQSRGQKLDGVSNIWIPFVLLSLGFLREGGAFAFVLPSEFLATISAAQVRSAFIHDFESLRVDMFPRDSFPDILQDVIIVSGTRASQTQSRRTVIFSEYDANGFLREWRHEVTAATPSWTRYLLTSAEWDAFAAVQSLPAFAPLGSVASIGVAIVTGANEFFTADRSVIEAFDLAAWREPLLARTADCLGLTLTHADHQRMQQEGKKAWLLDFSAGKPDPLCFARPADYIEKGMAEDLPSRYKCRIRTPWYRIPPIQRGTLMMAKRAHYHHRLLLNAVGAYTTDTIYRGEMKPLFQGQEKRLISGFHNSATLLSAELEGRSYGGGVLELVPSEISRLCVPMVESESHLARFDEVSRKTGGQRDTADTLASATDEILSKALPEYNAILPHLRTARTRLRNRRFHG